MPNMLVEIRYHKYREQEKWIAQIFEKRTEKYPKKVTYVDGE